MSHIQTIAYKKVKARKWHKCDSCGMIIIPRFEYWRYFLKDGRLVYVWKEHDTCREAAKIIWDHLPYYTEEWSLISEVGIEDVKLVVEKDKILAILVFGSDRVKEAQENG